MKVDPLPPIPSPPAHLWRQFRVKVMPIFMFVVVAVLAVWLWSENLANPLVMGTAQGLEADVSSPKAGIVVELRVTPYQEIAQGEVIAVVRPVTSEVLSNTLAVLRAEMEVIRTEDVFDGGDQVRYAQFHLDWMLERVELVALKSQLTYAENEYQRVATLLENKIVDPTQYDVAKRDRDQARQSVEIQTTAVADAERALRQLDPSQIPTNSASVLAGLRLVNEKLRLAESELQPIVITAPIDGRISRLNKLAGTTVTDGEAIVTIASPRVDYILGYVGQPLRIEPTLGMKVEVRSRGLHRAVGAGQITQIGPRIELFNAPLRVRGMGNAQERGLPIIVSVPPGMKLRPGELVDLALSLN